MHMVKLLFALCKVIRTYHWQGSVGSRPRVQRECDR